MSRIDIYETFHAGGVKAVLAKDPGGQWQQLWKTESVENIEQARIFSPPIKVQSSSLITYSKTCVKWLLKNRQNKDLDNNW